MCLTRLDEYYRFITSDYEALRLETFESDIASLVVAEVMATSVTTQTGPEAHSW